MDQTIVRLLCAGVAVVFGAMIFMRRRNRKAE